MDKENQTETQKRSALYNLKSAFKPVHFFSFGFVLLTSIVAILYGTLFGFSETQENIDTFVDVIPSSPFRPGVSATTEHAKLMDDYYEDQRKDAEEQEVTAVPPIPPITSNEKQTEWQSPNDEPKAASEEHDEIPAPEEPVPPPTINLSELGSTNNTWEPNLSMERPPLDANSLPANSSQQDEANISQQRIEEKMLAIKALVNKLNSNENMGHQEQKGAYWVSHKRDTVNETDNQHRAAAIIPATSRFVCRTTHAVNSQLSTVPLVEAECLTGVLKDGRIQGQFTIDKEHLNLEFTSFHKNGHTVAIKGYPIDPKTKVIGLATEVDKHTLSRHLALVSSAFLEGIGTLVGSTKINIGNNTIATETKYDAKDRLSQGVNKIGSRYSQKAEEYFDTDPTISVRKHQEFTLMIVEDVAANLFPLANR